jgi:hypothetical protein
VKLEVWDQLVPFIEKYGNPIVMNYGNSFAFFSNKTRIEIGFYFSGQLSYRTYRVDGILHRPVSEGPALEAYSNEGKLYAANFVEHGDLLHQYEEAWLLKEKTKQVLR